MDTKKRIKKYQVLYHFLSGPYHKNIIFLVLDHKEELSCTCI